MESKDQPLKRSYKVKMKTPTPGRDQGNYDPVDRSGLIGTVDEVFDGGACIVEWPNGRHPSHTNFLEIVSRGEYE